jgi:MoxR-like ATPase
MEGPVTDPLERLADVRSVADRFRELGYVMDRSLATVVLLLVRLQKPLLIEGHAGVGKTELAKALADVLETRLIRLQCYEGLDINSAVYEWNYQKQLLAIKIQEGSDRSIAEKEAYVFGADFLLYRPLLQSISCRDRAPVLLIDEIDRADEAFEALLLELLSDFQVTIPELGTIKASRIPYVILTSNGVRELSEALRRRCLFHWIDYPSLPREIEIVGARLPECPSGLSRQIVQYVHAVRQLKLSKNPGVAETLDLGRALLALNEPSLDVASAEETMGCVIKSAIDRERLTREELAKILPE